VWRGSEGEAVVGRVRGAVNSKENIEERWANGPNQNRKQ